MEVKELRKRLLAKKKKDKTVHPKDLLSTGSTLLNLACSGTSIGGFLKGKYYFLVGDSASGKTFLSLTCLAEAAINKEFKDYRFIYDNAEDGAMMDIEKFFGSGVAARMTAPGLYDGELVFSETIEDFYYNLDDAIGLGQPFIYILDSMDALSSEAEADKFNEQKQAYRKGKTTTGSYGDGKAKKNSAGIRKALSGLRRTGSILIIINQTRDNLGFGFEKKTRSGGHALRFYATLELWSSVKSKIKKTVKGKLRQIGVECRIQIKKNRITGRESDLLIPIYHSFGIDDLGSCVDYLLAENHWEKRGQSLRADEFGFKGKRESFIKMIEENELEDDLRDIVGKVWNEIESLSSIDRKKRYA